MANGKITNADIFDRLESLRRELTKQIQEANQEHRSELSILRHQFEKIDTKYNKLALDFGIFKKETEDEGKNITNKVLGLWSIFMILISSIFYWVVGKIFGGVH